MATIGGLSDESATRTSSRNPVARCGAGLARAVLGNALENIHFPR